MSGSEAMWNDREHPDTQRVRDLKAEVERLTKIDPWDKLEIKRLEAENERLRKHLITRRQVLDAIWVAFVVLGCSFAIILGIRWLVFGSHHCC